MDFVTTLSIPLTLIAIGGLVLITQRNGWLVVGALFVQWMGLAWQVWLLRGGGSVAPVELVTALGCCAIFGLTIWSLERKKDTRQARSESRLSIVTDQLWLWAVAVVAGVAGFGLARLYPLGGGEEHLTAFYWTLLPAMLGLVVNGSRDHIKLGASIISLFNAGLFLVYVLGATSPGVGLLGLAALGRLAVAAIIAYSWLFIKATYLDLDLNSVFDMRDSKVGLTKALALVPEANLGERDGAGGEVQGNDYGIEPELEAVEVVAGGEPEEDGDDA